MVNVVAKPRGGGTKTRRTAWLLVFLFISVYLVRFIKRALDDEEDPSYSLVENAMYGLEGRPANKRIAYIMYGNFSPNQFQERVAESLKTWLKDYGVLYYVVNKKWRNDFELVCKSNQELVDICRQIIPIHINCPEDDSSSPDSSEALSCCKHDQGMAAMWRDYPSYDWYVYLDDDIYLRTGFMNDFLSGLSPVEPVILTDQSPQSLLVVANNANCSSESDFLYPRGESAMVYSNVALRTIAEGFEMNAVSTQFSAFDHDATSYQTANALVHWMYSLPHVRLPLISGAVQEDFHSTFNMIGLHGAGNKLGRNSEALEIHRHVRYRRHPKPPYAYQWHRPRGFTQTSTYRKYGEIKDWTEWHAQAPLECLETTAENNQT